jgi:hypothetical protein
MSGSPGPRAETQSQPAPITQRFTDTVPQIDASAWRVRVSVGGASREVAPDELAAMDTVRAILDCTNG